MKKLLFVVCLLVGLKTNAVVVPGSSFPITNNPPDWATFLIVDTNGNGSADPNTRSNLQFRWDRMKTVIINDALTNSLIGVSVLSFGAVADNTTDNTAAFQAAINTGKIVFVPPSGTNGYVISNLIMTNGAGLVSFGAKLIFKSGSTGWMIKYGVPVIYNGSFYPTNQKPANISFFGFTLDGGSTSPQTNTALGTRHGVWFEPYGEGIQTHDLYIKNFNGVALMGKCYAPQSGSGFPQFNYEDQAKNGIYNVVCESNWCGIGFLSGTVLTPDTDTATTYLCEYQQGINLKSSYNHYGLWMSGGNNVLSGCNFSRNDTNVFIDGAGNNNSHSTISSSTINHSSGGIVATNAINGMIFDNCQIWFCSITVNDSLGIVFQNGIFGSSGGMTATRSAACYIRNNTCFNQMPIVISVTATNCSAYGNALATTGEIDTSPPMTKQLTNFAGLVTSVWPPTFVTLQATTTNSVWQSPSNSIPPHWWFGHFDADSNVVYDGHMP